MAEIADKAGRTLCLLYSCTVLSPAISVATSPAAARWMSSGKMRPQVTQDGHTDGKWLPSCWNSCSWEKAISFVRLRRVTRSVFYNTERRNHKTSPSKRKEHFYFGRLSLVLEICMRVFCCQRRHFTFHFTILSDIVACVSRIISVVFTDKYLLI
jgi:hypothetical protein